MRTRILHCGRLWNVRIGPCATLDGAARLENGTVCSHPASPAFVGEGVIARDFIFQTGSHVTDGAMLTRCYVGQSTAVGHGFTASDTYFACNCQAENGEACAVFAGPYTVTHHKATLLIGGMFSFMNAGSATNQSNHAYKLGPSHHGVLERGCKTGSGSHISWPVRIGAFSLVMGHCDPYADSRMLPFSYVVEREGANYIIPGIALRGVGTLRDIRKWPQRDGRPADAPRLDYLVFEAFSPYTMERILQGHALLADIENHHISKTYLAGLVHLHQFVVYKMRPCPPTESHYAFAVLLGALSYYVGNAFRNIPGAVFGRFMNVRENFFKSRQSRKFQSTIGTVILFGYPVELDLRA